MGGLQRPHPRFHRGLEQPARCARTSSGFAVRAFVGWVVLGFSVDDECFERVAFGEGAEAGVVGGWVFFGFPVPFSSSPGGPLGYGGAGGVGGGGGCGFDAVDGEVGVLGGGLDDGFEGGGAFAVVAANEHVAVGVEVFKALGEEFLVVFSDGPECGCAGGGGGWVDDDAVEHFGGVFEEVAAVGGDAGVEGLGDVV